uniref:Uncharacterized protein n=1 Tax=uncultured marine bacterium 442 TaxID=257392 RepID=Q6SH29_9BACT|nr:hypothetical protein MBMO_EBAC000-63A02.69 [uncultured marine bacterium 442]
MLTLLSHNVIVLFVYAFLPAAFDQANPLPLT